MLITTNTKSSYNVCPYFSYGSWGMYIVHALFFILQIGTLNNNSFSTYKWIKLEAGGRTAQLTLWNRETNTKDLHIYGIYNISSVKVTRDYRRERSYTSTPSIKWEVILISFINILSKY